MEGDSVERGAVVGAENDDVIFAVLINGPDGMLVPGPQYEVTRELFEASTTATQI